MKRILKLAFDAIASAHEKRVRARLLAELDPHTLRDIGLEAEANRRDEALRSAARSALY